MDRLEECGYRKDYRDDRYHSKFKNRPVFDFMFVLDKPEVVTKKLKRFK